MRVLALVALLVLGGCTSARERDCTALLPLADEAQSARRGRAASLVSSSTDANVTTALRRLGEGLRRIEPLARSIGVPAKEAARLVSDAAKAGGALSRSQSDAERADADLRGVCRPKP